MEHKTLQPKKKHRSMADAIKSVRSPENRQIIKDKEESYRNITKSSR